MRACCTVHSPVGVRGDAAQVHPAGAVLDEHQHVHALQQHGVHVQEVDREDPGGLGVQELPPGRAGAARRRIDARSVQDLPHGGRRDCRCRASSARRGSGGVPTADSPSPAGRRGGRCPGLVGGRPGLRRLLVSYLLAASLRCQASSVAGVTGKISAQRLRGMSRASAANHTRSAGSYRTRPTCRRSTAFSCRSTSSSASFARSPRNTRTARPSTRRVSR